MDAKRIKELRELARDCIYNGESFKAGSALPEALDALESAEKCIVSMNNSLIEQGYETERLREVLRLIADDEVSYRGAKEIARKALAGEGDGE